MNFIKPLFATLAIFILVAITNYSYAQSAQPSFEATTDPATWKGVALPLKLHANTGIEKRVLQQSDFDFAANMGANVVRLAVHADPAATEKPTVTFVDKNGNVIDGLNSPGIADLKVAVAMAAKVGIKIIIDMHAGPNTTSGNIFNNQADWDNLLKIWAMIAGNFKNNPNVIAFDLMNEPKIIAAMKSKGEKFGAASKAMFALNWTMPQDWVGTPRDYNFEITKIIKAIRDIDPNRTVIVEGFGELGNPANFAWLKPIEGFNNVVYSAHVYQPIKSTMIGMNNFENKNLKGERFIYTRGLAQMEKAIAPVVAFQHKYNVPIYIGEFGVSDDAVFKSDENGKSYNGSCWITTMLKLMSDNHFGWTYWDFWHKGRMPQSTDDPRYIALSACMRHKPLPEYCKIDD